MTKKNAGFTSLKKNSEAESLLDAVRPIATAASDRLMDLRLTTLVKTHKPDHSLVTNADFESDQIIRDGLRRAFPEHSILTEESGLEGSYDSEFLWVVDPLDGTRAYAKGRAGFSVMIGLLKKGAPYAGVVMDPWEGHLYEAVKGHGAFHIFQGVRKRVQVSKRSTWEEMPIVTSTGFSQPAEKELKNVFNNPWLPAINSVGIKVGLLVRQEADIYINHHHVHYWDTIAPYVVLDEAGGMFTDMDGEPLQYQVKKTLRHAYQTLATNGTRHEDARRLIQPLMPRPS